MNGRQIGFLAGLITVVGIALNTVPVTAIREWLVTGDSLLRVGTIGQTYVLFQSVVSIVATLAILGFAGWLGYRNAGRIEGVRPFLGLVAATTVGSIVGMLVAWGVMLWLGSTFTADLLGLVLVVASFLEAFVSYTLVVVMAVVAGAAVGFVWDMRSMSTVVEDMVVGWDGN